MRGKRLLLSALLVLSVTGILLTAVMLSRAKSTGAAPESTSMIVPICLETGSKRPNPVWDKLCPPQLPSPGNVIQTVDDAAEVAMSMPICIEIGYGRPNPVGEKPCPPIYPYPRK